MKVIDENEINVSDIVETEKESELYQEEEEINENIDVNSNIGDIQFD